MSMMHCDTCDVVYDSDFETECPNGCDANPIKEEAYWLAYADYREEAQRFAALNEDRRINAMSDDFAYTNGSDNAYRRAISASHKRLDELFRAVLYLA